MIALISSRIMDDDCQTLPTPSLQGMLVHQTHDHRTDILIAIDIVLTSDDLKARGSKHRRQAVHTTTIIIRRPRVHHVTFINLGFLVANSLLRESAGGRAAQLVEDGEAIPNAVPDLLQVHILWSGNSCHLREHLLHLPVVVAVRERQVSRGHPETRAIKIHLVGIIDITMICDDQSLQGSR